jgi:hypothetical protein
LCLSASIASAQSTPVASRSAAADLSWKRAAAVELSLAAVFAGAGTALVITQPGDFATGLGIGHLMWTPGLLFDGIVSAVNAGRVREGAPPMMASASLRARRWDVALAAVVTVLGGAAIGLASTYGEHRGVGVGVGAVYVGYGTGLLTYASYRLACAKRATRGASKLLREGAR